MAKSAILGKYTEWSGGTSGIDVFPVGVSGAILHYGTAPWVTTRGRYFIASYQYVLGEGKKLFARNLIKSVQDLGHIEAMHFTIFAKPKIIHMPRSEIVKAC